MGSDHDTRLRHGPFPKRTEVIVIIGKAGAGKSTFINSVLGRQSAPVGEEDKPCTEVITPYTHSPPGGAHLILLDTPGFEGHRPDGEKLSSEEIISELDAWFSDMKNAGAIIRQIIVLHSIADESPPYDITPSGRMHRLFEKMTKDMALALVTTHWDEMGNDDEELDEDEAKAEEEGIFAPESFLHWLRRNRKDMTAFRSGQSSDAPGYTSPVDVIHQLISDFQSDESSSSTSAASVAESEEEDPDDRQENDGKASANTVPKESLVVMPRKLYDFAASKAQQKPQVHTPTSGQRILLDSNAGPPPAKVVGPPVATDVGGEPLYIGSAVVGDSVYPCKLGAHLDQFCHFANGGKEVRHKGQYYLLPFVADQMEWVDASHGYIPYNREPVEGGNDGSGATLYHVLLRVDGIQVPGKTGRFLGGAFASFQGVEHFAKKGYKILCWKPAGNAKN